VTRRKNARYTIPIEISLTAQLHAPNQREADRRANKLLDTLAERLDGNICHGGGVRLAGDPTLEYRGATFSVEAR
jgi:hypothetical protein